MHQSSESSFMHHIVLIGPAIIIVLLILAGAPVTQAQHYWMNPVEKDYISLEIDKPHFDSEADKAAFGTMVWYFSGQYYFNKRFAFTTEVPLSIYKPSADSVHLSSETAIGNIYIGVMYNDPEREGNKFRGHVGFRLPLAPVDSYRATLIGTYTSFDRFEAFARDYATLSFAGTFVLKPTETFAVDFSIGGNQLMPTGEQNGTDFFLDYNVYARNYFEPFIVGAGIAGKVITSESGSFEERSTHQFALSAYYFGDEIQPGLFMRFPLDEDFRSFIDWVIGVRLIFSFQ